MELEPAVEKRFRRIEAILLETAEGHRQAKLRMDDFDKKLQATRKLVEDGTKFVSRLSVENRQLSREVREVSQIQKAMLRSNTNGKNGHS
ncbi:MAG: hypothetical protein JWO19_5446 [Bryobacterales bacterium]|nr:hypothetical protein [Bryobacterales bacterium]